LRSIPPFVKLGAMSSKAQRRLDECRRILGLKEASGGKLDLQANAFDQLKKAVDVQIKMYKDYLRTPDQNRRAGGAYLSLMNILDVASFLAAGPLDDPQLATQIRLAARGAGKNGGEMMSRSTRR